jgi:hypothetical protein
MVHRMAAALAATHIGQLGERIKEIHGRKIYHLASMKQPCPNPLSQNYLGEGELGRPASTGVVAGTSNHPFYRNL